jgi:ferric-dicitrate binding protein FerR (iron transport regulator)
MPDDPRPDASDDEVATLVRLAGPREAPPGDTAARVRQVVEEEWRQRVRASAKRRRATWSGLGLAVAASLMFIVWMASPRQTPVEEAVMVGVVERINGRVSLAPPLERVGGEAAVEGREVARGAIVRTGSGSYAGVRTAAGVLVRLDADTELRIVDRLTLQLERGAIYVDSGTHVDSGLEVRTPLGTTRDVGTRFEVRLMGAALRVRVRDGLVRLDLRGMSHDAAARDELTASADGSIVRRTIPLNDAQWAWVIHAAPPFVLEGRTLADLIQWVEREGGLRVKFNDLSIQPASIRLHGSIDGLTPAEALTIVLPTCGLVHRVDNDHVVIDRAKKVGQP